MILFQCEMVGTVSMWRGTVSMWNGTVSMWNGNVSMWNGTVSMWNDTVSMWRGTVSMWNGTVSMWNGSVSMWNGTVSMENGTVSMWMSVRFRSNMSYAYNCSNIQCKRCRSSHWKVCGRLIVTTSPHCWKRKRHATIQFGQS